MVLVTCISNIDFFVNWKPADNAKLVNTCTLKLLVITVLIVLIHNSKCLMYVSDWITSKFCNVYQKPKVMSNVACDWLTSWLYIARDALFCVKNNAFYR